ncbi:MAG: hypothetical protein ABIE43_01260 [Patescibacteria group bacterium]
MNKHIKNKLLFFIISMLVIFAMSGCSISFKKGDGGGTDGGVYVTVDKGNIWQHKILIPTISGRPKDIAMLNANSLAMDPSDEKAIYFGSVDNGLFYTYDSAQNWQIASNLSKETINYIAIDPSSKCIIYSAILNKVYKSTDCNRTWSQVYYDNDIETKVNNIAIDHYDSANVYIGTSRGEIIKSSDRGANWQTIGRFEDEVKEIAISPHDSRVIFVATAKKGIYRSKDKGINWINLQDELKDFQDNLKFRDLVLAEADQGRILLATSYGLLESTDNGDTWSKIELITPEKKAIINAIAVSPKNSKEIYYVTDTTFYRSLDGGKNWATKKLPTTRAGWRLLIDPNDTNIIYLGVRTIK